MLNAKSTGWFDLPASAFAEASASAHSGYGEPSRRDKGCRSTLFEINGVNPELAR